jgi:hypothetical protein
METFNMLNSNPYLEGMKYFMYKKINELKF